MQQGSILQTVKVPFETDVGTHHPVFFESHLQVPWDGASMWHKEETQLFFKIGIQNWNHLAVANNFSDDLHITIVEKSLLKEMTGLCVRLSFWIVSDPQVKTIDCNTTVAVKRIGLLVVLRVVALICSGTDPCSFQKIIVTQ